MANEIRLRSNNQAGVITDNPLAMGATTINSAAFTSLPTVGATNHLMLILDPLETNGAAEIVMVTAHSAAATSVTVIRGSEGTVARAHILNTVWYHGPVTSDTIEVLTSSTRPTSPYTGEAIYEVDTNVLRAFNGTAWGTTYLDPPACKVSKATVQAVPNITVTTLVYDTEIFDTASLHDTVTNNNRITAPVDGLYTVGLHANFASDTDYERVLLAIRNSAGAEIVRVVDSGADTSVDLSIAVTTLHKMTAGDWVDSFAFHENTSGGSNNVTAVFWAVWAGRG